MADDDVEIEAGDETLLEEKKEDADEVAISLMARSETKKNADVWLVKRDA